MFCSKCGAQVTEGADFCHNCGISLTGGKDFRQEERTIVSASELEQSTSTATVQAGMPSDFKEFVDNYVRTTTKFQSAEDLLQNSKPLTFIWICIAIPAIAGLIAGGPIGMLVLGGFFGYAATFIASGIIRKQYRVKFKGEFNGDINIENLIAFLNESLKIISSDFHEWGYLSKEGLLPVLENAVAKAVKEVRICGEFGAKRKDLVVFYIRPQNINEESEKTLYFIDALRNGFLIDGHAAGFLAHSSLIKTAPILHAAMEYYLKQL